MNKWFECTIRFDKIMPNGISKKVSERYLVDSISFTEAEARIIEESRHLITGEFVVTDIKRARLNEIFFNENGDLYYKVKINFLTIDEQSGREKKTPSYMLVQASTIDEAKDNLSEGMKGTLSDYVVESIKETKIVDVFPYEAKEKAND